MDECQRDVLLRRLDVTDCANEALIEFNKRGELTERENIKRIVPVLDLSLIDLVPTDWEDPSASQSPPSGDTNPQKIPSGSFRGDLCHGRTGLEFVYIHI